LKESDNLGPLEKQSFGGRVYFEADQMPQKPHLIRCRVEMPGLPR
jgi:hypothetical protein